MGAPTHVQVIVKRARNLKAKGKDGTNDAFVIIGLGKEKFRTSVKEKTLKSVEWLEECELSIPRQGNTAEIVLKVMHQGQLGAYHFLGMISIPLKDLTGRDDDDDIAIEAAQKPITKWYLLKCKPNQNKTGYRGDLEVTISFLVKHLAPKPDKASSFLDVNDTSPKHSKGSLQSLNKFTNKIGGSLISLRHNEKRLWKKKKGSTNGSTNSLPRNISAASRFGGSLKSINSSCCSDSLENLGGGEVLRMKLNPSFLTRKETGSLSSNVSNNGGGTNVTKHTLGQVMEEDNNDVEDEWNVKLSSTEKEKLNTSRRKVSSAIKDFVGRSSAKEVNEKKNVPRVPDENLNENKIDGSAKVGLNNDKYLDEKYMHVYGLNGIEPKESNQVNTEGENNRKNIHNDKPSATNRKSSLIENETPPPKPPRVVIGRELSKIENEVNQSDKKERIDKEVKRVFLNSFQDKSKEELIGILVSLQEKLETDDKKINELEEYLESLLFKVIMNAPHILEAGPIENACGSIIKEERKTHRYSF